MSTLSYHWSIAMQDNIYTFRSMVYCHAGECLRFQTIGLLPRRRMVSFSDHWPINSLSCRKKCTRFQITGLLTCMGLSTLSDHWSIALHGTVYAFRSLVYWHAWDCLRFQTTDLLTCMGLSTPPDHWSIGMQETVYALRPLVYCHAWDIQITGLLPCSRRSTPSDHWSIAMQSKTEMTACVQGNKSKHTRG